MIRQRAVDVKPLANYNLEVTFDNGEIKIFDVKPYFVNPWFLKLKDIQKFNTVHIAGLSIEWADGQDISPDCLYDDSTLNVLDFVSDIKERI